MRYYLALGVFWLLAGCLTGDPFAPSDRALVIRPGTVAVNVVERRAFLDAQERPTAFCLSSDGQIPVLTSLQAPSGYGLDERYNSVSNAFRRAGAGCLIGSDAACRAIRDGALSWVRTSGLSGPVRDAGDGKYWNDTLTINMRLLSPMATMLALSEAQTPLKPGERAEVLAWLETMIDRFEHTMRHEGSYKGGDSGTFARRAAHNHATQSSLAAMSYGALVGDDAMFRIGLEQWDITLGSMRADGSLPIETRRGARALFYQGRTISALIQLAERARVQDIDLYARPPEGVGSIHQPVAFFIAAMREPDIVLKYARTNHAPGPSKDYTRQYLGGGSLGWVAPYMARFPDHPNTLAMRNVTGEESYLAKQFATTVRGNGASNEWIGVDARCFYAEP